MPHIYNPNRDFARKTSIMKNEIRIHERNCSVCILLTILTTGCFAEFSENDDTYSEIDTGTPKYTDGDSTDSENDKCPGFEDALDADSDGMPDGCDGCPNDPGKLAPGPCGCGIPDSDASAGLPVYDFSDVNQIYRDDATVAEITSEKNRTFYVGQMLRVRTVDDTHMEIANFIPVDLTNAIIKMSIIGGPTDVKLLKICAIPAHGIVTIEYPFVNPEYDEATYTMSDGTPVDLSAHSAGVSAEMVSFDFTGEGEIYNKLKKLKNVGWELKVHDFNPDGTKPHWANDPEPRHARLYTAFMINLAYMWVNSRFMPMYLDEPIVGNDGTTLLSNETKTADYESLMGPRRLNLGVLSSGSGLGFGTSFGNATYILKHDFFYGIQDGVPFTVIGKMLGYDNDSSMTYAKDGVGFKPVCMSVTQAMFEADEFPITQANYYMQSDHQIICTPSGGGCPWYMECTGSTYSDGTYMYCE